MIESVYIQEQIERLRKEQKGMPPFLPIQETLTNAQSRYEAYGKYLKDEAYDYNEKSLQCFNIFSVSKTKILEKPREMLNGLHNAIFEIINSNMNINTKIELVERINIEYKEVNKKYKFFLTFRYSEGFIGELEYTFANNNINDPFGNIVQRVCEAHIGVEYYRFWCNTYEGTTKHFRDKKEKIIKKAKEIEHISNETIELQLPSSPQDILLHFIKTSKLDTSSNLSKDEFPVLISLIMGARVNMPKESISNELEQQQRKIYNSIQRLSDAEEITSEILVELIQLNKEYTDLNLFPKT